MKTGKRKRAEPKIEPPPEAAAAPQPEAGFCSLETGDTDAPAWPAHPVLWMQPALMPEPPRSSDLLIERRHKIPAPGFIEGTIGPFNREPATHSFCEPLPPRAAAGFPESDLAPVGQMRR